MEKVADNLYVIIGNGGNVAVMPTSEGVLLVDDKFAEDGPAILAKVKTVSDKPIRYVLNTHQHPDHTGGNAALLAANAQIIIHENARANMVRGNMPGLPRVTFRDETRIFLGGREVRAKYLGRGHTNGDVVIYFPEERVLHTGDLFIVGNAPFTDTANGGSLKELDQTVMKALQYDADVVIPGHGPVSKKADLARWPATIAALRERVGKACAGGADDAIKRVDLSGLGLAKSALFERGLPGVCRELAN